MNIPVRSRPQQLNLTPLIDIVFLLLVFFIYAMLSMAVHRSLPVQLPSSSSARIDKSEQVSITVRSDGAVYVDKEPVSLEILARVLTERTAASQSPRVLLFGDRNVSYQRLFSVLDRIQEAGISQVSLEAEAEAGAP